MLTYRRMLRLRPPARLALNHDATPATNFSYTFGAETFSRPDAIMPKM
jgi:hypothetical protein